MMKKLAMGLLLLTSVTSHAGVNDILLSKKIKPDLRAKIEKDLDLIEKLNFSSTLEKDTLSVMGLSTLTAETASDWLNQRVNYIIEENAFSVFNLLIKRVVKVERKNVTFPNANITPYSMNASEILELDNKNFEGTNDSGGFTVMSNVGAALYLSGKQKEQVYALKVSRGFLHKSEKVEVESPRAGIIQIGEGLFANELTINKENPDAFANSIFRLSTFFHEARHSDGNGESLGFTHATCPAGHDYEGSPACDENLNGPYTVGRLMMTELYKICTESTCSAKDKETIKMLILDNASRILKTTNKKEAARNWDPTPESL